MKNTRGLKEINLSQIAPLIRKGLQFPQFPNAAPLPILITDTKARIFYANPAWEKLTGYSFAEVKGKNPHFLNSGKTSKRVYQKLWSALAADKTFSTDKICDRRKDGSEYQVFSTFFPIKKGNRAIFYAQIQYDITQQYAYEKNLQEKEELLELIINNAFGYAIYLIDKKGIIKTWNDGAQRLNGYSASEIVGKHISLFYPSEDKIKKKPQKLLKIAAERGRYEEEMLQVRKDGSLFWAHVVTNAIYTKRNTLKGFVKIIRDITHERELKQQKDAFIGIASHELKTPITTLSAYAQLLQKRVEEINDPRCSHYVDNILNQSNRLVSLMNDLLNVSRIDAGKMEIHLNEINLFSLIKKVILGIQATTKTHKIELSGQENVMVSADALRIEQVMTNLLTNAIKYSPDAKKIIVTVRSVLNLAQVSVQDFGLGIASDDIPHIFQQFYRTKEKQVGQIGGFGLGLYISQEILKRHHGNISVESNVGKGSRFTFSLPLLVRE